MKMKRLMASLILSLLLPSFPSEAIPLLDREETVILPGGTKETILVNNLTGQVVQYHQSGGWSSANQQYMKQLQRSYDRQKKRKKHKAYPDDPKNPF